MIPPALLARLASLELVARAVVDGALHGAHYTDRPGFSQEFAEYRDYMPGDDPRFVDWNAYARTDRTLLKLFEGETNTRLLVLLDTSASMDAFGRRGILGRTGDGGGDAPSKLRYAAYLAAALTHIAGRQHDAAGLLTFDDAVRTYLPPRLGQVQQIFHRLDELAPSGGSDWTGAFTHAASHMTKRGIIAAISDFYCEPADFGRALRILGSRGHDLIAFHVLDADERRPRARGPLGGNVTLRDAESGQVIEVDATDLRARYPERLDEHEQALRREAGAAGAHYVRLNADEPLDRALIGYLRFRNRRP
ncbi:MAG: DUF58 domain-containing protein [Gammaproteobacteria bacterium]|nr:DUF58 domain-containing protein [Gammaproteobacteria bacterium]